MRVLAIASLLLLVTLPAGAQATLRAKLVGQRIISSYPGAPILVCQYRGPRARYEVIASSSTCAPYLQLD